MYNIIVNICYHKFQLFKTNNFLYLCVIEQSELIQNKRKITLSEVEDTQTHTHIDILESKLL